MGGGAEAEHALAYDDSEELMDRLQAEAWRRKYEGGLARLQQLERDNQRMREALVRVETLVPVRSPPPSPRLTRRLEPSRAVWLVSRRRRGLGG